MQVGRLRTCGLKKESAVGTLATPPTTFLRFVPPDSFYPKVSPIIGKAVGTNPDVNIKQTYGLGELNGMKIKLELEPENIGEVLNACFGLDTKTGPTNTTVYTHTFSRQAVTQLPTYSWWFDKNPLYPQFAGCMLNKVDLSIKPREIIDLDTEWIGLAYDATGVTHAPSYSTIAPMTFNMAVVNIDGSPIANYGVIQFKINNMVKADHVLSQSIYPGKIYSEGMDVEVSAELYFEDATQYNKFLAGTTAHIQVVLTHSATVPGSAGPTAYSLTIDVPKLIYQAAPLPIPSGVLKIGFSGRAMLDVGGTGYAIQMALANGVSTQY